MWSPDRRVRVESDLERQQRAMTAPKKNSRNDFSVNSSRNSNNNNSRSLLLPPIHQKQRENLAKTGAASANQVRFLALKVETQRKERKEREIQREKLQSRVNEHLETILTTHKQHKKEEMMKWKSYINETAPPAPSSTHVARAREFEKQQIEQEKKERRERAREKTKQRLQRGVGSSSSSSSSGGEYNLVSANDLNNNNNNNNSHSPLTGEAAEADAKATSNFNQLSTIYKRVLRPAQSEAQMEAQKTTLIAGDFTPSSIKDLTEDEEKFGPLLVGLSPDQRRRISQVEKSRQATEARISAKRAMYERAQRRRDVATQRIKEDPPADVLVQADLRRYIPADLLETLPDLNVGDGDENNNNNNHEGIFIINSNNNKKDSVFLTGVDAEREQQQKQNQQQEEEQEGEGEGGRKKNSKKKKTTKTKNDHAMLGSVKAQALQGGPLKQFTQNNKRLSIFARETLLKLETTTALRSMMEQSSSSSSSSHQQEDSVTAQALSFPASLDPVQEERKALEYYRKYHEPVMRGGSTRGVGKRGMTQMKPWSETHPPQSNDHLPRPSRTLFFDQEAPKEQLRNSLFSK